MIQMKQLTDAELAALLALNDEAAFCELYIRYKDKLYRFCFALLKSKEEAEEIVQEIFIRLWESRAFIRPELSFSSFLYTMARNRLFNYFRTMDIEKKVKTIIASGQGEGADESSEADSEVIYAEYRSILHNAITQLPPQRQRVFRMSRLEGMMYKEIAAELGISVNTVQEHITESLKFIKTYFSRYADMTFCLLLTVFNRM